MAGEARHNNGTSQVKRSRSGGQWEREEETNREVEYGVRQETSRPPGQVNRTEKE